MNTLKKIFTAGFCLLALAFSPLQAQEEVVSVDFVDSALTHYELNNPQDGYGVDVTQFVSVPACYVGGHNLFVVIDSIDNAVDIITRPGMDTVRFTADIYAGRHDLVNILRPRSVGFADGYVVVLASSKKDSSYLAVLDLNGQVVSRLDFNCCSYAFQIFPDEIVVAGRNQQGYDFRLVPLANGIENLSAEGVETIHYHKPKQADRIRESDPVGIGLTVVAVSVVFLALLCISLIIKGYGKLIMRVQDRKANKHPAVAAGAAKSSETSGEIYAAIATAIYLYDEELHDEEDTVITIQKVERAWTPWNAKFYNMNRYFINKR